MLLEPVQVNFRLRKNFSSPFVKLYAPRKIEDEVYEQITRDLPEKCSIDLALDQAKKLLSKIEIIDDNELNIENS